MICPNCGKINRLKVANCKRCGCDFAEINQHIRCCRLSSLAVAAIRIFILCIIAGLAIAIASQSDSISSYATDALDKITFVITFIIGICLFIAPVLAVISSIRISLSKGKLYGYRSDSLIIALMTILLTLILLPSRMPYNQQPESAAMMQSSVIIITLTLLSLSFVGLLYLAFAALATQTIALTIFACILGGWFGWLGRNFHCNIQDGWHIIYISVSVSAFIAVAYCLMVYKMTSKLPTGYLRCFMATSAIPAGMLCSATIHLLFMMYSSNWELMILAESLGWGLLAGGIMGAIANNLVFHPMLKWQPIQPPRPADTPPCEGGEL